MKARLRVLLERCIEDGLQRGYDRAHKHVDVPSRCGMVESMDQAIWLEIDTYFNFTEDFEE
jgi:hypothetical protein